MNSADSSVATTLATVRDSKLGRVPAGAAAKVVRRIVDQAEQPKLDVAAFNSSI